MWSLVAIKFNRVIAKFKWRKASNLNYRGPQRIDDNTRLLSYVAL